MRIVQTAQGWFFEHSDGTRTPVLPDKTAAMAALVAAAKPALTAAGALPEKWESIKGIAFSEDLPGYDMRDFTNCTWSWRSPDESLLPLMFQTTTEFEHYGASLAGWIEAIDVTDGVVVASGSFYDIEAGRSFRDVLAASGKFGVSVDPGPRTEATYECVEYDEDGFWCELGKWVFSAYEVIGLTGCPFPAFAAAAIRLAGGTADDTEDTADDDAAGDTSDDEKAAVAAAGAVTAGTGTVTAKASRKGHRAAQAATPFTVANYRMAEPEVGDPLLIEQGDGDHVPLGTWAVPLTITEDRRVFGHLAYWGQCHIGFAGQCITPPLSAGGYRRFHIGSTVLDDGSSLATGNLFFGTDHADLLQGYEGALDHYATTGAMFASVRAVNGVFGPWVCGALLPHIGDDEITVLRAAGISGDWRWIDDNLELCAALSVASPGFGIAREPLVAGSRTITPQHVRYRQSGHRVMSLVAANVVASQQPECTTCGEGDTVASMRLRRMARTLDRVVSQLDVLEHRTRHLRDEAAAATLRRIGR